MIFYEAKVVFKNEIQREKNTNDGNYLTNSLSYADCENHIMETLASCSRDGDEMQIDIKKTRLAELLLNPNLQEYSFFKVKVSMTIFDGEKEKHTSMLYLVQATDIQHAIKVTESNLSSAAGDTEVISVQKTPIIEYYNFLIADPVAEQA